MALTQGIHHVTAMAGDAQRNRDFYEGVLGLRLVKQTVNFDDPSMYHLYYGDGVGSPGTILTFFPIPGIRRGTAGAGVVDRVDLAVPEGALDWWQARLRAARVPVATRGGRVDLEDPDGMRLSLVATDEVRAPVAWDGAGVPADRAVQGVHGVAMLVRDAEVTEEFTARWTGLERVGPGLLRSGSALGGRVHVTSAEGAPFARMGAGTVHHVAFRAPDGEAQRRLRDRILGAGWNVSPVMDRDYFTSIYFREPNGVLLEIATDPPGFTRDEDVDGLGGRIRVPGFLGDAAGEVAARLSPLRPAAPVGGAV